VVEKPNKRNSYYKEKAMATYYLDLNDSNYTSEVLSFYLWGQKTPPSKDEMADDKWIDERGVEDQGRYYNHQTAFLSEE
jgi:hypothetical protein